MLAYRTASCFSTFKLLLWMWNSLVSTQNRPLQTFLTLTNHKSSSKNVKWTHNWVGLHGWVPTFQCSNYKTSPKDSTTSTAEYTTHKNCELFPWSKTTCTQVQSTKCSKANGKTFQWLTLTLTRSEGRTCSDSRRRLRNMTRSKDILTWFTRRKCWITSRQLHGWTLRAKRSQRTDFNLVGQRVST